MDSGLERDKRLESLGKNLSFIQDQIAKSFEIKKQILEDNDLISLIDRVANEAIDVYKNGNKILIAGNGGSAADAQHIAAELVSRFYFNRPGLPAMALTTNTSILSAVGNDYGFESIFSRQIQANGQKGDMFIAISTSGNSSNIIKAVNEANNLGLITVGLTGMTGGDMAGICRYCIKVPSDDTPRIQESHIMLGHIICSIVEESIFGSEHKVVSNIMSVVDKVITM